MLRSRRRAKPPGPLARRRRSRAPRLFPGLFGGDEFAVVLPDTPSEGAVAVGDRIRDRVSKHVFLKDEGINFRLTASAGVATLPDIATSVEELLQAADDAMYWGKAHGKDGIQLAGYGSLMNGRAHAMPSSIRKDSGA